MKTFLVLSALASIAIAAPTNQESYFISGEDTGYLPEYVYREKKSPQDFLSSPFLPELLLDDLNIESEAPEARTHFKHKGPIVVKKKSGYHVYRDSDEERDAAEPGEKCNKQLRVKLCNEDITGKSTSKRNTGIHNDDVESTIKIAREAIASLQRDIRKLEKGANEKKEQIENAVDKIDMNIHQNIESVRDALLRVDNLKAINIQPKNTETEVTHDQNNHISGDKKSTQWKEATQNNLHEKTSPNGARINIDNARLSQWKDATQNQDSNLSGLINEAKPNTENARLAQWKDATQNKEFTLNIPNKGAPLNIENARLSQWKDATQNKELSLNIPNNEATLHIENARLAQWKDATLNKEIGLSISNNVAKPNTENARLAQWKEAELNKEATTKTHTPETAKIEQEKLSQWKNAMDNIHGLEELPRNMENSFLSEHQGMMKSAIPIAEHDMSPEASTQSNTKIEYHNQASSKAEKSAELPKSTAENQLQDNMLVGANQIHDALTKSADSKWGFHGKHENEPAEHKNAESIKTEHGFAKSVNNQESTSSILNPLEHNVHNKVTGKHAEQKVEPHDHQDQYYKDVFLFMKNAEQINADEMGTKNNDHSLNEANDVSGADTTTQAKYAVPLHKHIEHKHIGYLPVKEHHHYHETNNKYLPKIPTHHGYHHGKSEDSDGTSARYGASPIPQPHMHEIHMKKPHLDEMHSGHGHMSMNKPHMDDMHLGHGHTSINKPHMDEIHSGHSHMSINKPHMDDIHSGYGHKSISKPLPKSAIVDFTAEKQLHDKTLVGTNQIHDPQTKSADSKWDFHSKNEKHEDEHHHKNIYIFMKNAEDKNAEFIDTKNINDKKTDSNIDHNVHNKVTGKHAEQKEDSHGKQDQHYKNVFVFMKNAEQSNADEISTKNKDHSLNGENHVIGADTTTQAKYAEPAHMHIEHKHTGYFPVKAPHHYHETNNKYLPKIPTYHGYHHGKSEDSDGTSARYGATPMPQPHMHEIHLKKPHFDEMHSGHGHMSVNKPHMDELHSGHGYMSMKKPHMDEIHSGYGHMSMNKPHYDDMHMGHGHFMKQDPQLNSHHHGHYSMHGKASEFDSAMQPSDFMIMPDFVGKSALENIQWKDHFAAARAPYGAPSYPSYSNYNFASSGGSDAIGVFPHANSGCAIPLLLNCSPNVVHGKMVKPYSNYGTPSYRNDEDLSFIQKRDILTTNDNTQ